MNTIPYKKNSGTTAYKCSTSKFGSEQVVYANDAREAAEKFAEITYHFYDEKFCVLNVEVKEANNHYTEILYYSVDVKIEPVFNAYKIGAIISL